MVAARSVRFDLIGGRPCLDFVNTVGGMRGVEPREKLGGYADLAAFFRQAGLCSAREASRLLRVAEQHSWRARAALEVAKGRREALYAALFAQAERRPLHDPLALEVLNEWLLPPRLHAAPGGGVELRAERETDELLGPLAAVAADAFALFYSSPEALARVRVCGNHEAGECAWLFLDETKNHSRRWCDMKDCGNRAKQRRHYQRVRG